MAVVVRAEDIFEEDVKLFPGLLAAILYTDMDVTFSRFIRENWFTLHDVTGNELLVLTPDCVPSRVTITADRFHLMRPLRGVERTGKNFLTRIVSDHFGISFRRFPCVLFFDHPLSREAYCFSFRDERNPEDLAEAMKEVIARAREIVVEEPVETEDENELRLKRTEMMQRLIPELRKAKLFRTFKKLISSKAMTNVARIGGGIR